ncbi:MAG: anthranilate phosphoribosyltransferase [Candidatus Omnitrophica bacterium]|nr:anthranilate phosphoribosyltransferase [Candidatus Omnitrophota bacterium]
MKSYIEKLQNKKNLTQDEIEEIMHEIMSGASDENNIADFLLALREKGPTVDEITGAAKIMRKFVVGIDTKHKDILDTCGTGGDKKNTFNISTIAALVVAGAGVAVAKHGNRSVSSKCGSADVLEALGVNLNVEQEHLSACLDEVGIAFLFAQKLHPAMKNVASVRKKLGVETIFNILGPLTNPARATHQIMGVYSRDLVEPMVQVLKNLGLKRALVVHGSDGLDEITTTDKTFISEYDGNEVISYDISPDELGISIAQPRDLEGGDLETNVRICEDILGGKAGPKRDIVLINAAYALYVAGKVSDISSGMDLAKETIDSGKALDKLNELRNFTQRFKYTL